jgi:hypothetical protein
MEVAMATVLHERLEKAVLTPMALATLTDALYEQLRGQMARKKDVALLDTLVMLFSYRVAAAQGGGKVSRGMNAAIESFLKI